MKAKIIGQKLSESVMDFVHGGGTYTKRLYIEEMQGLVITVKDETVHAFIHFEPDECDVLGEVDVPDWVIKAAMNVAVAKKVLDTAGPYIATLMNTKENKK
jgi:hypothetical protein